MCVARARLASCLSQGPTGLSSSPRSAKCVLGSCGCFSLELLTGACWCFRPRGGAATLSVLVDPAHLHALWFPLRMTCQDACIMCVARRPGSAIDTICCASEVSRIHIGGSFHSGGFLVSVPWLTGSNPDRVRGSLFECCSHWFSGSLHRFSVSLWDGVREANAFRTGSQVLSDIRMV